MLVAVFSARTIPLCVLALVGIAAAAEAHPYTLGPAPLRASPSTRDAFQAPSECWRPNRRGAIWLSREGLRKALLYNGGTPCELQERRTKVSL
jgi:hypothetical protein